jgi:hypothetical protein
LTVLGVRCSNKDFTYIVLDGTKAAPRLIVCETLVLPKGFAPAQSLHWLFQEVTSLIAKHSVWKIVIKRFEGRSRGSAFETRVEHEAAVMLAAGAQGNHAVFKKVNRTLAKDLGQKGHARYLSHLNVSWVQNYSRLSDKQKEALQAAWSELT